MNREMICQEELRRGLARARDLNGLDYLEVAETGELRVFLLGKYPRQAPPARPEYDQQGNEKLPPLLPISPANFRIRGGRRVPGVEVLKVEPPRSGAGDRDDVIVLHVERPNDPSNYTLELVNDPRSAPENDLRRHFDDRYTSIEFSFVADCPSELDCARPSICPPKALVEPEIDYLARDYQALRQLILERLALIAPEWQLRAVPDLGMALVELLAFTGDRLSYFQDAVATEAYLGTARQRISLRRHARLVDYTMHEGCNARAFVCVSTDRDLGPFHPEKLFFTTAGPNDAAADGALLTEAKAELDLAQRTVFEPLCETVSWRFTAGDIFDWATLVWKLVGFGDALRDLKARHQEKDLEKMSLPDGVRLWRRLPAKLRQRLREAEAERIAAEARTEQPALLAQELQRALITGLNRIVADRGFFRPHDLDSQQVEADATVLEENRHTIEGLFDEEIALAGRLQFFAGNSTLHFHTWGNRDCCLPAGATHATLRDEFLPSPAASSSSSYTTQSQHCPPPKTQPPRRRKLRLRAGDVLVFQEEIGPKTGSPHDADPARRHAVRLTRVTPGFDRVVGGGGHQGTAVVEVEWAEVDALPFAFCISTRAPVDAFKPCVMLADVSVAYGNTVLVHHGRRILREELGKIGREQLTEVCRCEGHTADPVTIPELVRWRLKQADVTFAEPLARGLPASKLLRQDPHRAVPRAALESIPGAPHGDRALFRWKDLEEPEKLAAWIASERRKHERPDPNGKELPQLAALHVYGRLPADMRAWIRELSGLIPHSAAGTHDHRPDELEEILKALVAAWTPRPDLLASGSDDRHFVLEMDDERRGRLRFGAEGHGRSPEAGALFRASYHVGNGEAGNVGAEKIARLVLRGTTLSGPKVSVCNPLPASGGAEPESAEEVRRNAPFAYRRELARAITADDYTAIVLREFQDTVQRAAAELRWTGSRYRARVAIDPLGREVAPPELLDEIATRLRRYRRIGHDVEVVTAVLVPLRIALRVCVRPHYQPAHVEQSLLEVFSSGLRSDGDPGFFHPDRLTFGEPIRLSKIVAAAQAVAGVASVRVTEFQRYFTPPNHELENGLLPLGPLEIARLENDPAFPENGTFTIDTEPAP